MAAATMNLAAIDLRAESGRVMLGRFDGRRVTLEELHRFETRPVGCLAFTDVAHTWRETLGGLSVAAARCGGRLDGVGTDTWGVDFARLDGEGALLSLPHHYRDALSDGMLEAALAAVPRSELSAATGVQFLLRAVGEGHGPEP